MNKIYTKWYHYTFLIFILILTFICGNTFGKLLTLDWIAVLLTNIVEITFFLCFRSMFRILKKMGE